MTEFQCGQIFISRIVSIFVITEAFGQKRGMVSKALTLAVTFKYPKPKSKCVEENVCQCLSIAQECDKNENSTAAIMSADQYTELKNSNKTQIYQQDLQPSEKCSSVIKMVVKGNMLRKFYYLDQQTIKTQSSRKILILSSEPNFTISYILA